MSYWRVRDATSLGAAVDQEIWQYAADHGFVIVSKDLDFYNRSLLLGSPPKVIWLRIGNCSSARHTLKQGIAHSTSCTSALH